MAWNLTGEFVETCSCNMLCPCWYGSKDLMLMDQGWCGTSILVRIREGDFEGTSLDGLNAVVSLFFPGPTLLDGNGTGRVYIDEAASEEEFAALEKILQAQSGGAMEVPASLLTSWLPTQRAPIKVTEQDGKLQADVGNVGEIVSQRLVNDLGDNMTMQNTAFILAFQFDGNSADLAPSDGTTWRDSDMPQSSWECKSGAVGQITWSVA